MKMRESKTEKIIILNPYGKFLGYSGMSFVIRKDQKDLEKHRFFEVGEIVLQSGNSVSVGSLVSASFWGIDVLLLTSSGRPVGIIKSLDDDSHVKTRIAQYEALKNEKGKEIKKQIILGKIKSQKLLLQKYKLKIPNTNREALHTKYYFQQIGRTLGIEKRESFKAYDGNNNLLNLAYEILAWKIHRALLKAKLEPYLSFLHSLQHERPSLVWDIMELYRVWIDDFIIKYLRKNNLKFQKIYEEGRLGKKKGKIPRMYLMHTQTNQFIKELTEHFKTEIPVKRIKSRAKKQKLETLINEECIRLAQYIRNEKKGWIPRIIIPNQKTVKKHEKRKNNDNSNF